MHLLASQERTHLSDDFIFPVDEAVVPRFRHLDHSRVRNAFPEFRDLRALTEDHDHLEKVLRLLAHRPVRV